MFNYRVKRLELKLNLLANSCADSSSAPGGFEQSVISLTSPMASPSFCSNFPLRHACFEADFLIEITQLEENLYKF